MYTIKKIFIIPFIISLFASPALARDYTSSNYILSGAKIVISGGSAYSTNYSLGCVEIGNAIGNIAESAGYTLDATLGDKKALFDPPDIKITNPGDGTIAYEGPITVEWTVDGVGGYSGEKYVAFGPNILTIRDSNGPYTSYENVEVYGARKPPALP